MAPALGAGISGVRFPDFRQGSNSRDTVEPVNEFDDQRLQFKICSTCKRELSRQSFSLNSGAATGLRSNCKSCARKSKSEWHVRHKDKVKSTMQRRRVEIKQFVHEAKQFPCMDCGKRFHSSLMDFDHRNNEEKLGSVSQIASFHISKKKVQAEIDKCDLVCCICHRVRTWNRLYPDDPITNDSL